MFEILAGAAIGGVLYAVRRPVTDVGRRIRLLAWLGFALLFVLFAAF